MNKNERILKQFHYFPKSQVFKGLENENFRILNICNRLLNINFILNYQINKFYG